jgi:hypothetical protein
MAYEVFALDSARYEVRCAPGDIRRITWSYGDDMWRVEEDAEHKRFRTKGEAIDRARLLCNDPDFRRD